MPAGNPAGYLPNNTDKRALGGATAGPGGPTDSTRPRYLDDFEAFGALPSPEPNEFIEWLFTSGILTEHQKDLIRSRMKKPLTEPGAATAGPAVGAVPTVT